MWTDHYRKRGFVYQPELLSQKQVENTRTASEELVRPSRTLPKEVEVVCDTKGALRTVFCVHRRAKHFRDLWRSNEVGDPIERIMGTSAYGIIDNIPNGVDNPRSD